LIIKTLCLCEIFFTHISEALSCFCMWEKIWHQFHEFTNIPLPFLLMSCILGLWHWQRLSKPFQVVVIYLIFNFLIEIGARVAGMVYRQNLPLLHLYTFGECLLFSLFYRQILDDSSVFKRYFGWILGAVLTLVALNTLFLQNIFEYNSYAKTLVQVLIILYALDYAFRFSEREDSFSGQRQPLRLFNAAVLIYYCGSLFIFMSSKFDLEMQGAILILWKINAILNLIFQLMVLVALWKSIFSQQKSSSSQASAF